MKKGIVLATCTALALSVGMLSGCSSSRPEEPAVPATSANTSEQTAGTNEPVAATALTPTDAEKLKGMLVGEAAVWRNYAVAVTSIDRANNQLTAHIDVTSRGKALTLSTECMMSFGMAPTSTSFDSNTITVAANETASGTLTFDDQYASQRLFWNDGATEAWWLLDQDAVQPAQAEPTAAPEQTEPTKTEEATTTQDPQKQAVSSIESHLATLFDDNTYYTFQRVDSATATVTPLPGDGYEYANTVAILDGNNDPATATIRTRWNADGTDCTSMELDGTLLF